MLPQSTDSSYDCTKRADLGLSQCYFQPRKLRQSLLQRGCKPRSLGICPCCQENSAVSRVRSDFTSPCPVLYAVLQLRAVSNLLPSFSHLLAGSPLATISSLRCWKAEHMLSSSEEHQHGGKRWDLWCHSPLSIPGGRGAAGACSISAGNLSMVGRAGTAGLVLQELVTWPEGCWRGCTRQGRRGQFMPSVKSTVSAWC